MTYLFILTILAGGTPYYGQHSTNRVEWRAQWVNGGKFDTSEFCKKAAANLGLKTTEFRCIKFNGEVM